MPPGSKVATTVAAGACVELKDVGLGFRFRV